MKNTARIVTIMLVLALATLACLSSAKIDPNAASGSVLFKDDFSKKSGGWDQVTADEGVTDYASDGYRILVNEINYYLWANPNEMKFADTRIEVDASKVAGPDANDIGIICRYVDTENFYFLTISSDGYFSVSKIVAGEENLVGMEELQFDDTNIHTGNTSNHLRADCVGSKLSLYANGTLLVEVEDTDLAEGNVGLIAGTWDTSGTDILFDNFQVIKP